MLLDGFHAIKHALRFGARVPAALTSHRPGVLALAVTKPAPDVRQALETLLVPVEDERLRSLVPRLHPTAVAALAERPPRAGNLETLGRLPRTAPVIVLDDPRNLGNAGAVIRLAAGFGRPASSPPERSTPGIRLSYAVVPGMHFATAVERLETAELPPGPVFALDAEGEDIRGLKVFPTTPCSPSGPSAAASLRRCGSGRTIWCRCRCVRRSPATTWRRASA
ncbi:hypothetical protein SALBM135S_01808 [Streptomyces alboniger]